MTRSRATLVLLLILLVLGLAGCGGSSDNVEFPATDPATETGGSGDGRTLNGTVGPGFDISLDGTDGLVAGSYTLVVNDRSSAHNFHLIGPDGGDLSTDVAAEGEQSFEVVLKAGEYRFLCDPHASSMNGSFTVG
ncbi:MAG: plastocyanin/azurin family copper-binding protein [Actinomycetota bacterium]|nr:plastocyanin/azurin family copper-binding protein [Actinomycetota bacterium]